MASDLLIQTIFLPYLDPAGNVSPKTWEIFQTNKGSEGTPFERVTYGVVLWLGQDGIDVAYPMYATTLQVTFAHLSGSTYKPMVLSWKDWPTDLTNNPRTVNLPGSVTAGIDDCNLAMWDNHGYVSHTTEDTRIIFRDEVGTFQAGVLVVSNTDDDESIILQASTEPGVSPTWRTCIAKHIGPADANGPFRVMGWGARGLGNDVKIRSHGHAKSRAYMDPEPVVADGAWAVERDIVSSAILEEGYTAVVADEANTTSEVKAEPRNLLGIVPQNCHGGEHVLSPPNFSAMGLSAHTYPNTGNQSAINVCNNPYANECHKLAYCGWTGTTSTASQFKGSSTVDYAQRCLQLQACFFRTDVAGGNGSATNQIERCLPKNVPSCSPTLGCESASGTGNFACEPAATDDWHMVASLSAAIAPEDGLAVYFSNAPLAASPAWEKERTRRAEMQFSEVVHAVGKSFVSSAAAPRNLWSIVNPANMPNIILNDSSQFAVYENRSNTILMGTNTYDDWGHEGKKQFGAIADANGNPLLNDPAFGDLSNNPGVLAHELGHAIHELAYGTDTGLFDNAIVRSTGHYLVGISEGFADFQAFTAINEGQETRVVQEVYPIEFDHRRPTRNSSTLAVNCSGTPGQLATSGCGFPGGSSPMLVPYECIEGTGGNPPDTCRALPCESVEDCLPPSGTTWATTNITCQNTDPTGEDYRCVAHGRDITYPRRLHGGPDSGINSCIADFSQFNGPSCDTYTPNGQSICNAQTGCFWTTSGGGYCTGGCNSINVDPSLTNNAQRRGACANASNVGCSWDPLATQCYYRPTRMWYCLGTVLARAMETVRDEIHLLQPSYGLEHNTKVAYSIFAGAVAQQTVTLDDLVDAIFMEADILFGDANGSNGVPFCNAIHAGLSLVNLHNMTSAAEHAGYPTNTANSVLSGYYPYPNGQLPGTSTSCDQP